MINPVKTIPFEQLDNVLLTTLSNDNVSAYVQKNVSQSDRREVLPEISAPVLTFTVE